MNSNDTLEGRYISWLYSQIAAVRNKNPRRSYWELAKQLQRIPFIWFVPNDDNRAQDGRDLRLEFLDDTGSEAEDDWLDFDCSFLEMLIALARRASFETNLTLTEWFWIFLDNLGIPDCSDYIYSKSPRFHILVDETVSRVIDRTYHPSGHLGLFPLTHPQDDQRGVELWYQLSSYLIENFNFDDSDE